MDAVIGGKTQTGNGWKMLMQTLATGRGISLPALSTGSTKLVCRNCGAYARIRKQFNRPVGEFEGIEELLTRMAGETHLIEATRAVTVATLDAGERPSSISAIVEDELTERMRRLINDGMDIQAGSGICLGPPLAQKQGQLPKTEGCAVVQEACRKGLISPEEVRLLESAESARLRAITVDDFSPDDLTSP